MAQDQQSIKLTEEAWTQITNGDVTVITFQVLSGDAFIRFTTDVTTPTEENGMVYPEWTGELNQSIGTLTNLSGAVRVWAKPASPISTTVYVDHA